MKNQYFGDINDYRKYGLLRTLSGVSGLPLGVCWLLTPDDDRTDGEFRGYLREPQRWRKHDPSLYDALQQLTDPALPRSVRHAPVWDLLPGASYFSALLGDSAEDRTRYFARAWDELAACPFHFYDPDNGLEVRSTPRGRRNSSKYLYWEEVEESYRRGHSMLIYQHFPRRERAGFIRALVEGISSRVGAPLVDVFATSHVLFLLVARPEHAGGFRRAYDMIRGQWEGQIVPEAHIRG